MNVATEYAPGAGAKTLKPDVGMLYVYNRHLVDGGVRIRVVMSPDFGWPEPSRNEHGVPVLGRFAGAVGEPAMHAPTHEPPDLTDRATFLLALDELVRRVGDLEDIEINRNGGALWRPCEAVEFGHAGWVLETPGHLSVFTRRPAPEAGEIVLSATYFAGIDTYDPAEALDRALFATREAA